LISYFFFLEKRNKKRTHLLSIGFTGGTHCPKMSSRIYSENLQLWFFAFGIVALKIKSSKYSDETNRNLTVTKPCRFLHPNAPFSRTSLNSNVSRNITRVVKRNLGQKVIWIICDFLLVFGFSCEQNFYKNKKKLPCVILPSLKNLARFY
jgi:hypothetical protein